MLILPGRFVESKYKLEIGAAQNTQLSKALGTGSDKGVFVLPKGSILSSPVPRLEVDLNTLQGPLVVSNLPRRSRQLTPLPLRR